ncbi:MAG: glutamate synthase subunit beta [Saprospiraceae bacterium]|nr:glutamate synthase subunit beta [Saprospiraceae bacterium]
MGKPTGFLEHTRALPGKLPVEVRKQHYREFVALYSEKELNQQASRCMNCGVPFCHSGCPLGNVIPEFNDAVYDGNWQEAYDILAATNNFPEFTGRICPAPCESACVLGINQPPVAIEEIEKHIIEIAFEKGYVLPRKNIARTGKKVAVIGSGPAGLAAAAQLNHAGHWVTVFERDDAAGGLLRYGIPDFKLEKSVIDRRIALLEEEGIVFRYNAHVGVNVSISALLREYNAIVLAGGATVPRDLDVAGRKLNGVHFAMEYLKQSNKRVAGKDPLEGCTGVVSSGAEETEICAAGKNVVVIGGGDTGSDCVGTANRQGAASVLQFELLPEPPASRTEAMPWPTYPMLMKTTSSHEEGCERKFAVATKAFIGDEKGNLKALRVVSLEWTITETGKPAQFVEIPGSERKIPCELALLAVGFLHPEHDGLLKELEIDLDRQGNVKATEKNYQTSIAKIFTAGDMRHGQSLVVWAISEGRECARKVDEYLMGHSVLETKDASVLKEMMG